MVCFKEEKSWGGLWPPLDERSVCKYFVANCEIFIMEIFFFCKLQILSMLVQKYLLKFVVFFFYLLFLYKYTCTNERDFNQPGSLIWQLYMIMSPLSACFCLFRLL